MSKIDIWEVEGAAVTTDDLSGACQLVYDALRKNAASLLAVQGVRATSRGGHVALMITRQRLRVGATYAGKIVTVHVEDTHFRDTCGGACCCTFDRHDALNTSSMCHSRNSRPGWSARRSGRSIT